MALSDKVEPVTSLVANKLKHFAKSTQDFTNNILDNFGLSKRRRPVLSPHLKKTYIYVFC